MSYIGDCTALLLVSIMTLKNIISMFNLFVCVCVGEMIPKASFALLTLKRFIS